MHHCEISNGFFFTLLIGCTWGHPIGPTCQKGKKSVSDNIEYLNGKEFRLFIMLSYCIELPFCGIMHLLWIQTTYGLKDNANI